MTDDNASTTTTATQGAESNAAFRTTMASVEFLCSDLASVIDNHDFEGVQLTAQTASDLLLAGCSAFRRLIERSARRSPFTDAAHQLLVERYTALILLFTHATKTIAVPTMALKLQRLHDVLKVAMAPYVSQAATASAEATARKTT